MTVLASAAPYVTNALMNANLFALAGALVIFALFNLIFVCGFYKTAYRLGKPFVAYIIAAFLTIGVFEAAHHIPGLAVLNAFGTERMGPQLIALAAGMAVFAGVTAAACKKACARFETIDL